MQVLRRLAMSAESESCGTHDQRHADHAAAVGADQGTGAFRTNKDIRDLHDELPGMASDLNEWGVRRKLEGADSSCRAFRTPPLMASLNAD